MEDNYGTEDYDFEDFEEYENEHSPSPSKRKSTPHSKKSPVKASSDWNGENEEEKDDINNEKENVEGQDLESYMKFYSGSENTEAQLEDLACETKPLDGFRPKLENEDEERLLHKLGYDQSYSNHSSPQKGKSIKILSNSPSPTMTSKAISFASFEAEYVRSSHQGGSVVAEENPSTRISMDSKASPTPIGKKNQNIHLSEIKQVEFESKSPEKLHSRNSNAEEDYMNGFKSLLSSSPPKNASSSKLSSPVMPNAADAILAKKPTVENERENAERVDALLMELFPERFEKQTQGKKGKGKGTKKAAGTGAGLSYNKNQSYGLGAPRPALSSLENGGAGRPGSFGGNHNAVSMADCDDAPLLSSLEQQLKLLRRELKTKDDKIARLTEHAVMMGSHMDRLKAETAHLTVQLRETNMELEAKEGRLQEALKARKKLKKAAAAHSSGSTGGGADTAVLENENSRLREREQALMDAIEELSNQNEDLICKLKESMERELVLSSKRAAQISYNVSTLAEQSMGGGCGNGRDTHLPHISGAHAGSGGLRTQSEPTETTACPKRTGRKKKTAAAYS